MEFSKHADNGSIFARVPWHLSCAPARRRHSERQQLLAGSRASVHGIVFKVRAKSVWGSSGPARDKDSDSRSGNANGEILSPTSLYGQFFLKFVIARRCYMGICLTEERVARFKTNDVICIFFAAPRAIIRSARACVCTEPLCVCGLHSSALHGARRRRRRRPLCAATANDRARFAKPQRPQPSPYGRGALDMGAHVLLRRRHCVFS
jgi:hypothetical protein